MLAKRTSKNYFRLCPIFAGIDRFFSKLENCMFRVCAIQRGYFAWKFDDVKLVNSTFLEINSSKSPCRKLLYSKVLV